MKVGTKLTALLAIAIGVWLVSETGSERMMLACGFGLPQPCKNADSARRTLYVMASGFALGVVMRKDTKT